MRLETLEASYDTVPRADSTVGAGTAAPRGRTSELMGIGVPPGLRRAGIGTAITRALVHACPEAGVTTTFSIAGNDAAASIYRRVEFQDVGTACIFGADDG